MTFVAGFPTCVGIDPPPFRALLIPTWFPHVRGDRPGAGDGWALVWLVSPRAWG